MFRPAIFSLCLSLSTFGCNTDETPRPQVEITALILHNVGSFDFTGDMVLLVDSTTRYEMAILTHPKDAIVKVSRGEDERFTPWDNFLHISGATGEMTIIAEKNNHRQSLPQRLHITHSAGQYLEDFMISDTRVRDSLYLKVNNKTRGVLGLKVISMWGHTLMEKWILKQQDTLHYTMDVSAYDPGIYLVRVHMGSDDKVFRFIIKP